MALQASLLNVRSNESLRDAWRGLPRRSPGNMSCPRMTRNALSTKHGVGGGISSPASDSAFLRSAVALGSHFSRLLRVFVGNFSIWLTQAKHKAEGILFHPAKLMAWCINRPIVFLDRTKPEVRSVGTPSGSARDHRSKWRPRRDSNPQPLA